MEIKDIQMDNVLKSIEKINGHMAELSALKTDLHLLEGWFSGKENIPDRLAELEKFMFWTKPEIKDLNDRMMWLEVHHKAIDECTTGQGKSIGQLYNRVKGVEGIVPTMRSSIEMMGKVENEVKRIDNANGLNTICGKTLEDTVKRLGDLVKDHLDMHNQNERANKKEEVKGYDDVNTKEATDLNPLCKCGHNRWNHCYEGDCPNIRTSCILDCDCKKFEPKSQNTDFKDKNCEKVAESEDKTNKSHISTPIPNEPSHNAETICKCEHRKQVHNMNHSTNCNCCWCHKFEPKEQVSDTKGFVILSKHDGLSIGSVVWEEDKKND